MGELRALRNFGKGIKERLSPPRKLEWLQFEKIDEFLEITVQPIHRENEIIVPKHGSHSLRSVAERIRENGYTFERLASEPSLDEQLHKPKWFRPCVPVAENFDVSRLSPIVVTDLKNEHQSLDPGSTYTLSHGDGSHRSLVYAVRLLRGRERFAPVEAIYFTPREI